MSTYHADPHDHAHPDASNDDANRGSSPVPDQWIPWVVMTMAAALIVMGFLILKSFAP